MPVPLSTPLRRLAVLTAAVALGALLAVVLGPSKPTSTRPAAAPPPPVPPSLVPAPPGATNAPAPRVVGPAAGRAQRLNAPDGDGERDVTVLRELTGAMLSALPEAGHPPLGSNEEFARALRGDNPTRSIFVPKDHAALDPAGRLVDRWGTPYHFHPRAPDWVEIRSAGPDRTLFTRDDFVDPWSQKLMRLKEEENRN